MIPVVFRAPRSLRALNVGAVGLAIAAMTTAAFMWAGPAQWRWALVVGLPSFVVGALWAHMLRWRQTIGRTLRVGWVLSVPLAAMNGALACALMMLWQSHEPVSFFGGLVLGATFGAIIWLPGLLLVLLLFGVPIARAQSLASRGLAGEDRGEAVVGLTCTVLAVLASVIAHHANPHHDPSAALALLFHGFVVLAAVCGTVAAVEALRREARRRKFVARVEADEEPGLRVEETTLGKRLVRIDTSVETYRVARAPDEELIELDHEGRAVRALR